MHIAATNPLAVSVDELDPNVVARERSILAEQARDSGKPEAIIDKMVEGRIRKYYEEVVLTSQTFVVDGERTVEQVIADLAVEIGASVKIAGFERMALGDGIEREQTDFAAEVAAAANS
jgi:elongation factor Ts